MRKKYSPIFSAVNSFLGVDGIDLEFGLTTTSVMEAHLNRQMIEVSQKVIVLSDSTKFGKRGFGRICAIEEIDQVITDSGISDHYVNQMESRGIEVMFKLPTLVIVENSVGGQLSSINWIQLLRCSVVQLKALCI